MYRILVDYGLEGHKFWEDSFKTAEEALSAAAGAGFCGPWIIVKIVSFVEK